MMDVFKKMWPDAWGVRMEHILRNVLIALLEQPNATLHDVLRLFSDKQFRMQVAKSLRNETVRTFLLKEFEQFSFGYRTDATAPIQNKVGAFLADPLLNRILTAPEKDLHIRKIMDQGQVLLVNLAKGHIGEDSSSLLGGLLVTTLGLAAFSRADMPAAKRRPFFVYVDEFQSFTTLAPLMIRRHIDLCDQRHPELADRERREQRCGERDKSENDAVRAHVQLSLPKIPRGRNSSRIAIGPNRTK